jgi:hypothetical protein
LAQPCTANSGKSAATTSANSAIFFFIKPSSKSLANYLLKSLACQVGNTAKGDGMNTKKRQFVILPAQVCSLQLL